MKNLIISIISISILLVACSDDKNTKVIVTGTEQPPIEQPPEDPPVELEPIQLTFWTSAETKFYDGEYVSVWNTGYTAKAESGVYSKNNFLHFLDEFGQDIEIIQLPVEPDFVKLYYDSSIDHEYIYTTETIDPETAYNMGAMPGWYTRIYQDDNEISHWYLNKYILVDVKMVDNNLYGQSNVGKWYHLNGSKQNIQFVDKNIICENFDGFGKTATINNVNVSWTYNWFDGSKYWFEYNNKFYSHNGYTFDGTTLKENGSAMWNYRFYQNVIIPAGNYNNDFYYIQCATGYLIKYNPATDTTSELIRLYEGDGTNDEGVFFKSTLNPVLIDNYLYFIVEANYYRYNFQTGVTTLFVSGVSKIYEF